MKKRKSFALKKSPLRAIPLGVAIIGGLASTALATRGFTGKDNYDTQISEKRRNVNQLIRDFSNLSTANLSAKVENPFQDIDTKFENPFEDMVGVDTTATDISNEQFQQSLATTLDRMQEMGMINAQQLANAKLKQEQNTRAILAQQVQQANILRAKGAADVQKMEAQAELQKAQGAFTAEQMRIQGAVDARNLQYQKTQGMLALEAGQLDSLRSAQIADKNWFERTFG